MFRFRPATAAPKSDPIALSYVVCNRPQVLVELCRAYEHKESATPAGSVLRELLKNEAAAAVILYDDGDEPGSSAKGLNAIDRDRPQSGRGVFWRFFDWVDKSSFEVAADAFTTFRVRPSKPNCGKEAATDDDRVGTPHSAQRPRTALPIGQLRQVF